MSAKKAVFWLMLLVLTLLAAFVGFNYVADPQCYYRCVDISLEKRTLNTYYQVAQRIIAHPDAQVVIVGSSRGETTPPLWIEKVTGLKTLNLSSAGAEFTTKATFVNMASQKTALRHVIWMADYFELIGSAQDAKIRNTPAFRQFNVIAAEKNVLSEYSDFFQSLLSHNTFEASLHFVRHSGPPVISQGAASDVDFEKCLSSKFQGQETELSLKKEIALIYQSYTHGVINSDQSPQLLNSFTKQMRDLAQKGVEVDVVIIPYHPLFLTWLKKDYPRIFAQHEIWIRQLEQLAIPGVHVTNSFNAIPNADSSSLFWNDGVHFNCRGALSILTPVISNWK